MINDPKSQRTFSIIIKLISFRNKWLSAESGRWPESVHFESVCFVLTPRDFYLDSARIQTQFLSAPDTFSRYPNIYLKLSNSIFCWSVVTGRRPDPESLQLAPGSLHLQSGVRRHQMLGSVPRLWPGWHLSVLCKIPHDTQERGNIREIEKVTKIKMCPDVNFPRVRWRPGHQSNVQLRSSECHTG